MAFEIVMKKLANGVLVPANGEEAEKLASVPVGEVVRCKLTVFRNYRFLQKYMVLVKFLYEHWSARAKPIAYRGTLVRPRMERFRKDLQILCGWYEPVYNVKGELRLESKSVSFSSMSEPEFEKLYSTVIDVGLEKILNDPAMNADKLRAICEELLRFDD